MTQKHKRPSAPASKKLPKKAAKPAAASAHSSKEKAVHAVKGKHVEKHVEVEPIGVIPLDDFTRDRDDLRAAR